jgi:hypothetical protein
MTDYAGIDYSLGRSNYDPKTGIHFGIIGTSHLNEWYFDDFEADYGAPCCPKCGNEATSSEDAPEEITESDWFDGKQDFCCENCEWTFGYDDMGEQEAHSFSCADKDYSLYQSAESSEIWVLASPYYTHAQFCSPCAPGAGNLNNSCESGPKTYALGHEYFEDGQAPYPVYLVADGSLVEMAR